MFSMKKLIWTLALGQFLFLFHFPVCYGVSPLDDTQLFQGVPPDVLILLDTSGSMRWPAGSKLYVTNAADCSPTSAQPFYPTSEGTHTIACTVSYNGSGTPPSPPNPAFPNGTLWYSNASCSGPFYTNNTHAGYTTKCRRIDIAELAVKSILDNDKSGTVTCADETSLGVRMGYIRFDTSNTYPVTLPNCVYTCGGSNHKYADILSNVKSEADGVPGGSTALASSLGLALTKLNENKNNDTCAQSCRQKSVILISDGADNLTCGQDPDNDHGDRYKGRKDTVKKAKALADAGYKVFVIGFGDTMGAIDKNTLNWAAFFGGTDDPSAPNVGSTEGVFTNSPDQWDPCNDPSNDPGSKDLSGYAFMAMNTDELSQALKNAISIIQATYSFSLASVASTRVSTSNYLYAASFEPINGDPFWRGHLKKYSINTDGSLGSVNWDAGTVLQSRLFSDRKIYTYVSGEMRDFTTYFSGLPGGQAKAYFDIQTPHDFPPIIGYIQGDPAFNADNWKLGDIFHSNPISVGSPSYYFIDMLSPTAFSTFRTTHKDRENIIVVGANDGQFRAFSAGNGSEKWSFIPPNLLPKLQYIAHCHSGVSDCTYIHDKSQLLHTYSVDGPVTVADVWLGTGDGKNKTADELAYIAGIRRRQGCSGLLK